MSEIRNSDELMNSAELADYLRLSRKRLQNLVSQGKIPYTKIGRSNRFWKSQIDKMLDKEKRGPAI